MHRQSHLCLAHERILDDRARQGENALAEGLDVIHHLEHGIHVARRPEVGQPHGARLAPPPLLLRIGSELGDFLGDLERRDGARWRWRAKEEEGE